ncbi:hypothetical protein SCG7086_AJ_00200 [Chlamydiales bacterium SCGC AG-110-P3]|nr:hypothetical protein SCG7086_AJ_00200 [Chlamydiales bacterium SCGC AG-110-P3]
MRRNLAELAIIAAGINSFLVVYACGRLFDSPEYYASYGFLTFFVTLVGVPTLAASMRQAARPWRHFLLLTILVFSPLWFSIYVYSDVFPFQQSLLAIGSAIVFYVWTVWAHLHAP